MNLQLRYKVEFAFSYDEINFQRIASFFDIYEYETASGLHQLGAEVIFLGAKRVAANLTLLRIV